jgi:soluble lytic murein transglycosylase-like protein
MSTAVLVLLIELSARLQGVDPKVAVAVAQVESNMNPDATGSKGERGLFQLHPKFFKGGQYYEPQLNIQAGVAHLKAAEKACGKKMPALGWLACYNAGVKKAKSFLHPSRNSYVQQVEMAATSYGKLSQTSTPKVQPPKSLGVAYVYSSR